MSHLNNELNTENTSLTTGELVFAIGYTALVLVVGVFIGLSL